MADEIDRASGLVRIRWMDSYGGGEWTDLDDLPERPMECESVGWLHTENAESLTLVPHYAPSGHGMGFLVIPKACVIERIPLREVF